MSFSKKMCDALKPSPHCDEEVYNIEFCANLGPARSWRRHFFDALWMQDCRRA